MVFDALIECTATGLATLGLPALEVDFTPTSNPKFGDYTTTVALAAGKLANREEYPSARVIAEKLVEYLMSQSLSFVESMEVAGPGFINIRLTQAALLAELLTVSTQPSPYTPIGNGKKVVVEYSSPNIAKPFTIGHLRSTIIGNAIANLYEACGYTVYRDNHVGDWGTQFGKLMVALQKWGNLDEILAQPRPVKELVALYVKFHAEAEKDPTLEDQARAWFTKLEKTDPEARRLWQLCVDLSWKEFEAIYQQLGVTFTENNGKGFGESFFEDKMASVIEMLEASGYLKEGKEGAKLFFFPDDVFPPLMILKKDGSTLYATRDLATDLFRKQTYGDDITIINEVGVEQEQYFSQLFKIEELLGWFTPEQRIHVKHGFVRLKESRMSTRKGNVIWLEDVIAKAHKRAAALAKSSDSTQPITQDPGITAKIAIGAMIWNDLKRAAHLEVVFDWDEMLSMHGNSGPYLQYCVVRATSVLQKAGRIQPLNAQSLTSSPVALEERSLILQLLSFNEVVTRACTQQAPHLLCTYLYTLAQLYNAFYNNHKIVGSGTSETMRLVLTQVTARTLSTGLGLLGIQIPEKM